MDNIQELPRYALTSVFNHQGFDALICAYQSCGGTSRADDLALLMDKANDSSFVSVAKRIVSREIFSFEWQHQFWVPMFQFDLRDMSLKQDVSQIMNELSGELDSWTLAAWFVEPNAWLQGGRPVDLIGANMSDVLNAARADRFIAAG
jgi:hypothetical protein